MYILQIYLLVENAEQPKNQDFFELFEKINHFYTSWCFEIFFLDHFALTLLWKFLYIMFCYIMIKHGYLKYVRKFINMANSPKNY